jgi:hypothetical protein
MIHFQFSPLADSEIREVRQWLRQPPCQLVREILTGKVAELQNESGKLLIESVGQENNRHVDATDRAKEALLYQHALTVLDRLQTEDGIYVRAKADVIPQ